MNFADLIAPLTGERFMSDYYDRKPLHIPAADGQQRSGLLSWARLNDLLAIRSHWTEANINLVMNSRPIMPDMYMEVPPDRPESGRLADPAKIEVFLAMGASLVANFVEDVAPEVRELTASLGEQFSGRAGANVYCSFQGIQAFASHCDLHEVFAVQCEGEKVWNIYGNRAASPVAPIGGDEAQAIIDSAKGRQMMQVRMQPGDTLYIPRGYYHDALASSGASLHVTLSVAPLTGRILFQMLEDEAITDELFRHYLPDARIEGGRALADRLEALAKRLAAIIRTQRFATDVADRQRQLWEPAFKPALPERPQLEFYARTDGRAEFRKEVRGAILASAQGNLELGHLAAPAEWIFSRPAFALQELYARFRHLGESDLRELAMRLERLDLLYAYTPEI